MCGIAGFIGKIENKQGAWMMNALNVMEHRGPDGNGQFIHDNVILGHTRLAIIDLSHKGDQPMVKGNLVMVMNGEIYNYKQLASYLSADDDLGNHTISNDCQTFLDYCYKYGINDAMQTSNGMWAFAIYDRINQTVTLSVDRFGQKPLYYYENKEGFYFASTPSALYPIEEKWKIDYQALDTYWQLGAIIGSNRIFKGIKKLCASERLVYDIKKCNYKVDTWYEPKERYGNIEQIINEAIDAVKIADVPVNIFLSGGIDSTLVSTRKGFANAIHLKSDEVGYAQDAATKSNINLQIADPALMSMDEILTDYVNNSGEPTMAGPIPYITSKTARQYGKVAVIANGADELFFGYDRLRNDDQEQSQAQNNHLFRGSVFPHNVLNRYRRKFNGKFSSRMTDLMTFVQFDINSTLDFASMSHGLEVRSPFLDHRLVEAALTIPESEHRKRGNKTILKDILFKHGYSEQWLNRLKVGFSLHYKPSDTDFLKESAWNWAIGQGYLKIPNSINGRDRQYLQASAMGLFIWFHHHYKYL